MVIPDEATAFAGSPVVVSISGGTPPYQAFSTNPAALPVPQNVSGNTLTLVANNVTADQNANIQIRDAAGQTAIVEVTVRPAFLLPTSIAITGNPNCSASGGTICSGQNGTASVLVTGPAGTPLPGRQVRFDVVQGDFTFVSTNPGAPLVATLTVVSDQNGFAVATLQAPANATTQIATIRATDVASGQQITSNSTIVAFKDGSAVLSVSPTAVTVPGLPATPPQCAVGVPVTYYVYGGTPPYTVAANLPSSVSITGAPILASGGGFTARPNACVDAIFTITDASGRFVNATLASILGPAAAGGAGGGGTGSGDCSTFSPPNAGCPMIAPSTLNLTACTGPGSENSAIITGGTPTSHSPVPAGVDVDLSATLLTVRRTAGTVGSSSFTLQVFAGSLFQNVIVNVTPAACP
jgi:hypothetical protein